MLSYIRITPSKALFIKITKENFMLSEPYILITFIITDEKNFFEKHLLKFINLILVKLIILTRIITF